MPLADAKALLGSHAVHIEQRQLDEELHALRQLAVLCDRFSPIVGLEEAEHPDCLLIDFSGCTHLFGGERNLCRQLLKFIREQGYSARLAIAKNVGLAWAVAHCGLEGRQTFRIVDEGFQAGQLPIQALRLSPSTLAKLREFDLFSLAQLNALPRHSLKPRFGDELIQRLNQLDAVIQELIVPEHLHELPVADIRLEEGITNARGTTMLIGRLLTQVLAELKASQHGVLKLAITLQKQPFTIGTVRPCLDAQELERLLALKLETIQLQIEVDYLQVEVLESAPLRYGQRSLLDTETEQAEREVASFINRLSSRLGEQAVLRVRTVEELQPEKSVEYIPAINYQPKATDRFRWDSLPQRPATLFPEPIPIKVNSIIPEGPPLRFWWQRREYVSDIVWGPERIETGWWREDAIRRDYYRVETTTHQRMWLFRRREERDWYLHGCFD